MRVRVHVNVMIVNKIRMLNNNNTKLTAKQRTELPLRANYFEVEYLALFFFYKIKPLQKYVEKINSSKVKKLRAIL